jgi:hypothetical protein
MRRRPKRDDSGPLAGSAKSVAARWPLKRRLTASVVSFALDAGEILRVRFDLALVLDRQALFRVILDAHGDIPDCCDAMSLRSTRKKR